MHYFKFTCCSKLGLGSVIANSKTRRLTFSYPSYVPELFIITSNLPARVLYHSNHSNVFQPYRSSRNPVIIMATRVVKITVVTDFVSLLTISACSF